MIKNIDNNYDNINLAFLLTFTIYAIISLIVPLQFIVSNKFITYFLVFMGILLATYNLILKKIYRDKFVIILITFFILNIITSISVVDTGFIENIKNSIVFYIYFFAIFPIFKVIKGYKQKKIINNFFVTILFVQTIAVIISIIQFLLLKGYRILDYKGIVKRQGFLESRLFGIYIDPNYMAIVSIITILISIYFYKYYLINYSYKYVSKLLIYSAIFNYLYIILSGSRTAIICILIISIGYIFYLFRYSGIKKIVLKCVLACVMILTINKFVSSTANFYLHIAPQKTIFNDENVKINKELNIDREDTDIDNISNNRLDIWKSTLEIYVEKPILGVSSGSWYEVSKNIDINNFVVKTKYQPHNGYIELLFYNGILAFIVFTIFIGNALIKSFRKINEERILLILIILTIGIANMFLSYTLYGISFLGVLLFTIISYLVYFNDSRKV